MYLYHIGPRCYPTATRAKRRVPARTSQWVAKRAGAKAAGLGTEATNPRRRRALYALLFYAVAVLLLAAPLPLHFFSTVARAVRQDVWLNVWALAWTSEHLLTAPAGLFDANIFFPHLDTLAYTDHFIGQAILAAPLYWLSGNAVAAYNLAWYAALILTGWGGYLWVRSLIGDEPAGEAAALVAGAVCLLVPGKRTALSHLQVISLQGVPLALFAVHSLLKRPGWRPALGLTAAAVYAALCSWYTAAYTALLLSFVGGAGVLVGVPPEQRRRVLGYGAAALLLAAAVMYPVALPYRAVQQEMAFERPLQELVATSLRPVDFISSWSWLHQGVLPQGSGAGGYFPGLLAALLAALGVRDGWRRGDRWPALYAVGAAGFAILALGPRLTLGESLTLPLPYELLYRLVPGFGALRNPYRAAFFATLLFAVPVGYGARRAIEWGRARLLYQQRWRAHPRLGGLAPVTWALAVTLSAVHLLEAWPGPQEIAAMPAPPSPAYEWLAQQDPPGAALVWPLPRPFDDNARYQLWTVGSWAPLVNGHSGLYPADFLELYDVEAEFPSPAFVDFLKQRFPVRYLVAHYGLAEGGVTPAAAAENTELEEVWSGGDDVIYRIDNGAGVGWMRRRLPARMLAESVRVDTTAAARGCGVRVLLNGAIAGEARLTDTGNEPGAGFSFAVALEAPPAVGYTVDLEVYLVGETGLPRVDLHAAMRPQRRALLEINGATVLQGAVVIAVLDADTGRLLFARATEADTAGAGTALRQALDAAAPGDEVLLAVAEVLDYRLIERLRLLLDGAGAASSGETLPELGTTYAFRGRIGAPTGSARESIGGDSAALLDGDPVGDCRMAPMPSFEMLGSSARR